MRLPSTSVFCVRGGALWVPPAGPHILPSITRAVLLEVVVEVGIPVVERFCSLEDLKGAEEVLLAGTSAEALGVVQVDEAIIGDGAPGPITRRLRQEFRKTLQ